MFCVPTASVARGICGLSCLTMSSCNVNEQARRHFRLHRLLHLEQILYQSCRAKQNMQPWGGEIQPPSPATCIDSSRLDQSFDLLSTDLTLHDRSKHGILVVSFSLSKVSYQWRSEYKSTVRCFLC